jgi:hypothetical protein
MYSLYIPSPYRQAYWGLQWGIAFTAFPDDALVRIKPDDIPKRVKIPKNGSSTTTSVKRLGAEADLQLRTGACIDRHSAGRQASRGGPLWNLGRMMTSPF